jgi:hypothetical protein
MTHSIIVRVSPDAIAPFREGKRLPTGAVGGGLIWRQPDPPVILAKG